MAKFLTHKPGFIKTVGNSVPAHYSAGSIIQVSADTPAVPWAQTGLAHDLAAFDARK